MRCYTLENILLTQKQLENEIPYFSGESNFQDTVIYFDLFEYRVQRRLQLIVVNLIIYSALK